MSEMVERVARALCSSDNGKPPYLEIRDDAWRTYVGAARTAIAAMREPTTEIRAAGGKAMYPVQSVDLFDEVWRVAIDVALQE